MTKQSILPSKLKTFKYYEQKLPLYLQNSYGFIEHFRIWYDMMMGNSNDNGVVNVADAILLLTNIFDDDYSKILDLAGTNNIDILDKLASLFGIQRHLSVEYQTNEGVITTEELTLTNKELLIFIKAQIIKNYCSGTFEQLNAYYKAVGLSIVLTTAEEMATANVYLAIIDDKQYSDNIIKLFKAGLLTISSVGISYRRIVQNIEKVLVWDKQITAKYKGWDYGEWSI